MCLFFNYSDVVVQILDARNPLLFRCEDLEKYVKEINTNKINMLLINKADFLTEEQRKKWAKYFEKCNIKAVFFSAKDAALEVVNEDPSENNDDQVELEKGNESCNEIENTAYGKEACII